MSTLWRTPLLQELSCVALLLAFAGGGLACGKKTAARTPATYQAPVDPPPAPVSTSRSDGGSGSSSGAGLGSDMLRVDPGEDILSRTLEELNADSPLEDIHFAYDSAVLEDEARRKLESHAEWLLRYPTVEVLIEGHCDERGTVEYNLALGERRAMAAYNYLLSLGVPAQRLKTISYGKEYPLDPGHNEAAWSKNRRAHFVMTSK